MIPAVTEQEGYRSPEVIIFGVPNYQHNKNGLEKNLKSFSLHSQISDDQAPLYRNENALFFPIEHFALRVLA